MSPHEGVGKCTHKHACFVSPRLIWKYVSTHWYMRNIFYPISLQIFFTAMLGCWKGTLQAPTYMKVVTLRAAQGLRMRIRTQPLPPCASWAGAHTCAQYCRLICLYSSRALTRIYALYSKGAHMHVCLHSSRTRTHIYAFVPSRNRTCISTHARPICQHMQALTLE